MPTSSHQETAMPYQVTTYYPGTGGTEPERFRRKAEAMSRAAELRREFRAEHPRLRLRADSETEQREGGKEERLVLFGPGDTVAFQARVAPTDTRRL